MRSRRDHGVLRAFGRSFLTLLGALGLVFGQMIAVPVESATGLSRYEAEQRQRENQARLNRLEAMYEGISKELAQILFDLDELENYKIPLVESEVAEADTIAKAEQAKSESLHKKLDRAQAILTELEQSLTSATLASQETREGIVKLARNTLKGQTGVGQAAKTLGAFLSPENSEEFVRALENDALIARILSRIFDDSQWIIATGSNQKDRMDEVRAVVAELSEEAEASATRAAEALRTAESKRDELVGLQAELAEARVEVESNQAEIQRQQDLAEAEDAKLRAEIARIAAEELANGISGPAPSAGYFGWPVANVYITQYFGGMTPYGTIYDPNHWAVDFGANCGTPIFASASGTIAAASSDYTGNVYVLINHGLLGGKSYVTSYNHMSSFIVYRGQGVAKGQIIGYVGSTGWSTGCHLHFVLGVDGVSVDPLGYIG